MVLGEEEARAEEREHPQILALAKKYKRNVRQRQLDMLQNDHQDQVQNTGKKGKTFIYFNKMEF